MKYQIIASHNNPEFFFIVPSEVAEERMRLLVIHFPEKAPFRIVNKTPLILEDLQHIAKEWVFAIGETFPI